MVKNSARVLGGLAIVAIVAAFAAQSSIPWSLAEAVADAEVALGFEATDPPRRLTDVRFTDAEGAPVTLEDKRGKVVVMNFWATWCGPCVREMPSLEWLQNKLGGDNFEVVAISEDREAEEIAPFYEKFGLTALAAYHDPNSRLARELEIPGLPTTLLIDARGYEVGRVVGEAEWNSPEALALIRYYLAPPTTSASAE